MRKFSEKQKIHRNYSYQLINDNSSIVYTSCGKTFEHIGCKRRPMNAEINAEISMNAEIHTTEKERLEMSMYC